MPVKRDEKSAMVAHPNVVGASSVPPTQFSTAYLGKRYLEDYYSNNPPPQGNEFTTIEMPALPSSMVNLAESYVQIDGYFQTEASPAGDITPFATTTPGVGPWVPVNTTITTPSCLSACFFNNVSMSINGVEVVTSQGQNQPYCHFANVIKHESYADRMAGEVDQGYIFDSEDSEFPNGASPLVTPFDNDMVSYSPGTDLYYFQKNIGAYRRQQLYFDNVGGNGSAKPLSFKVRLADMGLRTSSWLPPNTKFRIQMQRSTDSFLTQGSQPQKSAAAPSFVTLEVKLRMVTTRIRPEVLDQMAVANLTTPLTIPFNHVRGEATFVSGSSPNVSINNALSGPTPEAVYVFYVPAETYNGTSTGGFPAFRMMPVTRTSYWQHGKLTVGGTQYPVNPFSQRAQSSNKISNRDIAELYQMYRMTANASPFLTSADFTNTQPLCFQLDEKHDGWNVAENTSIAFEGTFAGTDGPFGAGVNWVTILIAFTPRNISIGAGGSVHIK